MRKERTLLIVGILIAMLPFLGFPDLFRSILICLSGLFVCFIAYRFYVKERLLAAKDDTAMKPFVDSPKEQ